MLKSRFLNLGSEVQVLSGTPVKSNTKSSDLRRSRYVRLCVRLIPALPSLSISRQALVAHRDPIRSGERDLLRNAQTRGAGDAGFSFRAVRRMRARPRRSALRILHGKTVTIWTHEVATSSQPMDVTAHHKSFASAAPTASVGPVLAICDGIVPINDSMASIRGHRIRKKGL
jgi:hypothetical protein